MRFLYVPYFESADVQRRAEVAECLLRNIATGLFDHVYLLVDQPVSVSPGDHLTVLQFQGRPTYSQVIQASALVGDEQTIHVLANADIAFDKTLEAADDIGPDEFYAITRYEPDGDGWKLRRRPEGTQDVWVWRGRCRIDPAHCGFYLGQPGCDNAIVERAMRAHYRVLNPALTIKARHHHAGGQRNYTGATKRAPRPYRGAWPSVVGASPALRILHVCLRGGTDQQPALKRAIDALGDVTEVDWRRSANPAADIAMAMRQVQPDLTFMQIQRPGVVSPGVFRDHPGIVVNWSGDVRAPLPRWYVDVGKAIDLTCMSNQEDVDRLRREGVRAEFLNIGFDTEIFTPEGRTIPGSPEIVFFGNNYGNRYPGSAERRNMVAFLKKRYGKRFGVYGSGWPGCENLMGQPEREAGIYRGCKIGINQNHFLHDRFSSDRIFRLMGSGAFCACRAFPNLYLDYTEGEHLVLWNDFDELGRVVDYYLEHDEERERIAYEGCELVHAMHTWPRRFENLLCLTGLR